MPGLKQRELISTTKINNAHLISHMQITKQATEHSKGTCVHSVSFQLQWCKDIYWKDWEQQRKDKKVLGMKGKRETETETEERKKSFQSVVQRWPMADGRLSLHCFDVPSIFFKSTQQTWNDESPIPNKQNTRHINKSTMVTSSNTYTGIPYISRHCQQHPCANIWQNKQFMFLLKTCQSWNRFNKQ